MLDVSTTISEVRRPIAQGLVAIFENLILSDAVTGGSEAFKLQKEALLSKVDKVKDDLSSRQDNESIAKLAELCVTYVADVGGFKTKLQKSEERGCGLPAWPYLQSNSHNTEKGNLKKANTVLSSHIAKLMAKTDSER